MMGGGALIRFNGGRPWLESAKQAEIRLAILLKMLPIPFWDGGSRRAEKGHPTVAFTAISAGYG
jgi:hypothetical protein